MKFSKNRETINVTILTNSCGLPKAVSLMAVIPVPYVESGSKEKIYNFRINEDCHNPYPATTKNKKKTFTKSTWTTWNSIELLTFDHLVDGQNRARKEILGTCKFGIQEIIGSILIVKLLE